MKQVLILGTAHAVFTEESIEALDLIDSKLNKFTNFFKSADMYSEVGFDGTSTSGEVKAIVMDEYIEQFIHNQTKKSFKELDKKGGVYNSGGEKILEAMSEQGGDDMDLYRIVGRIFGISTEEALSLHLGSILPDPKFATAIATLFAIDKLEERFDALMTKICEEGFESFINRMEEKYGVHDQGAVQELIDFISSGKGKEVSVETDAFLMREDLWDLPTDEKDKVFVVGMKHRAYLENYYSELGFTIIK